jgi:hypothetical protein
VENNAECAERPVNTNSTSHTVQKETTPAQKEDGLRGRLTKGLQAFKALVMWWLPLLNQLPL